MRRNQSHNTKFKRLKKMRMFVCDQDGTNSREVDVDLLIDPRGDTELLIEIPGWLAAQQGIEREKDQPEPIYFYHGRRQHDGKDVSNHRESLTADQLRDRVVALYRDYAKTLKMSIKREVIKAVYSVRYNHKGDGEGSTLIFTSDQRHYSYGGERKQLEIELSLERYWLIQEKELYTSTPGTTWHGSTDTPNFRYEHRVDSAELAKLIPFTEDLWNKLTRLKLELIKIGDMLHLLLNRDGTELATMIESGALNMPLIEDKR